AVDPDLVRGELHRHGAREVRDATLGGGVGDRTRTAEKARGGAYIDDLAAVALGHHAARRMLAHQERAGQRDRDHGVPLLLGDLKYVLVVRYGGIVDQDVDPTPAPDHGRDDACDVGLDGDVRHERRRFAAGPRDFGHDLFAASLVEIDHRYLGAFGCER